MMLKELIEGAKKDYVVYLVCLLSLLACLFTIYSIGSYQAEINNQWLQQWEDLGCSEKTNGATPMMINVTYNIGGIYDAEQDINQNT